MKYGLSNTQLLNIDASFGGNQAWYPKIWHKQSGCGPTAAANQMLYLAYNHDVFSRLYSYNTKDREHFTNHMQELFKYVTPGMMGVNHVDKLARGVINYAASKGITLNSTTFCVNPSHHSRSLDHLITYVKEAFSKDCPIAFLNLSRGREYRLQNWHWITITSVEFRDDTIFATASDEGRMRTFDLGLWFLTTPMHGGLVYFE